MASSGLAFLLLLASAWEKHLPLAPGRRLGVAVRLSRATYTSRPGSPLATDAGRRRRLVLIATVAEPPAADSGEAWDAGELPGVRDGPDASVSLVTPPRPPATEAAGDGGDGTGVDLPLLWAMVEPHTGHLGEEDRANLKLGLRVLISKVAIVCGADRDRSVHPPPAPLIEPSFRTPVSRQVEVAGDAAALGGGGEAGVSGGRDAPTSGDAVRAAAAAAVAAAAVAVAATAAAEAAQGKTIPPAAPDQMAAAAAPAAASGAGADAESPGLAASAARALVMLSAVRTGQDMLRLGLDAETVAAAMLSETAFTREAPTWPCAQPTAFTLRVDHLIEQARRLASIPLALHEQPTPAQLDDSTAAAVRATMIGAGASEPRALLVAVGGQLRRLRSIDQAAQERAAAARADAAHTGQASAAQTGQGAPGDLAAPAHVAAQENAATQGTAATLADAPAHVAEQRNCVTQEDTAVQAELAAADSALHSTPAQDSAVAGPAAHHESAASERWHASEQSPASEQRPAAAQWPASEQWRLAPADDAALALRGVQLYAPLAQAVGFASLGMSIEALSYRRLFPQAMGRLAAWYQLVWPDAQELLPQLTSQLRSSIESAPSLAGLLASVRVTGRVKTPASTLRKLLRGADDVERVRDVLAVRVVLEPVAGLEAELAASVGAGGRREMSREEAEAVLCYGAYRQVLRLWREMPGRVKDFIAHPKPNGYQSLHTNVRLADGRVLEVQLRSASMHERAERGAAAHGLYKGGLDTPGAMGEETEMSVTIRALRALPALPQASTFKEIDTDQSGFIETSELRDALRLAGRDASAAAVQAELALLDADGDGRISFDEFRSATWDLAGGDGRSSLLEPGGSNGGAGSAQAGAERGRRQAGRGPLPGGSSAGPAEEECGEGSGAEARPLDTEAAASGPSRERRRRGRRMY